MMQGVKINVFTMMKSDKILHGGQSRMLKTPITVPILLLAHLPLAYTAFFTFSVDSS